MLLQLSMVTSAMDLNGIHKMAGNIENLKPFQKGVSGNPKGRPKGVKSLSTVIQQLLADEELMDKISKNKPTYWESLPSKNAANALGMAMLIKAIGGDTKAAAWITKTGFGDKVDLTSAGERIQATPVIISEILPREVEGNDAEAEAEATPDN